MINDSCWLIILFIFAIIFYYSNQNSNQYLINEGFRNSKIYLGDSPIKPHDFLNLNDIPFASNSIYEIGRILYPNNNNNNNRGYYSNYSNYYPGYYSSYI